MNSCLLVPTLEEALQFPKGNICLGFCATCGFISNVLFDARLLTYSSQYEETQGFSPRFNAFAESLARRLIDRYDLHGKSVLEIGCGKGEFLALLCEIGDNTGIGIDPAYVPGRISHAAEARIRFITDFYSEDYANIEADFVCCRHTLEHIHPTREFLQSVRRSLGDRRDTIVFFEVPDVQRVMQELAFWDIYYEHCSYFSLGSLARLFRSCGFDVLDLAKDFDDQYLLIETRLSSDASLSSRPEEDDRIALARDVSYFETHLADKLDEWRNQLNNVVAQGQRAVLWGSGSKAVAYLNSLNIVDEIEFVVDINPFKHGKYLAGSGHLVVPPEFLQDYRPDVVIVMNPIYVQEIEAQLATLGVPARVVAV
ncbi:MAG TPA: methyltransferase domain-containing protein [Dehalococcoidia bacterium]|nr:methyltransferase domain-containing protein [Dehalococcoidia bacterium]